MFFLEFVFSTWGWKKRESQCVYNKPFLTKKSFLLPLAKGPLEFKGEKTLVFSNVETIPFAYGEELENLKETGSLIKTKRNLHKRFSNPKDLFSYPKRPAAKIKVAKVTSNAQ